MRLIGYIRVSTDEQDIGEGVQERAIQSFCELYEHELVDIYRDIGVSGGTALEKRPGGRDLLVAVVGKFGGGVAGTDGIVTHQMDRLFRSVVDGVETCDRLNRAHVELLTVHDKIDTSHPDGWAALAFRLVASEWERRKIAWRTSNAMAAKRERGECYGHAAYGLVEQGGRLYREPERWAVRERIVQAYRSGQAGTLRQLRAWLRERGIPSPKGRRAWGLNTLSRLISTHDEFKGYPLLGPADETAVSA